MITTTIKDLIQDMLGHRTQANFQITATPTQVSMLQRGFQEELDRAGLVPTSDISGLTTWSWGGTLIHIVEGDHFSIQELPIQYNAPSEGTWIFQSADSVLTTATGTTTLT